MAGKGFHHLALNDIELIRANLRDRYKYKDGFPVIKELLQNADDARQGRKIARTLRVAWCSGLPSADHQLLQGPCLLVVNDGPFTISDLEAIKNIGLSNKAGDTAAVGRFGLGLKSVFHLCEAFFFVARGSATGTSGEIISDILNPWSPALQAQWDQVGWLSTRAIQDAVRRINWSDCWFCLCLPLRKYDHVQFPIIKSFPGEVGYPPSTIFVQNTGTRMAKILPMLKNIEAIQGVNCHDFSNTENIFEVRLTNGSTRCQYPDLAETQPHRFFGSVRSIDVGESTACTHLYVGRELLLNDGVFKVLQTSELWPNFSAVDSHTGESIQRREKADPHCAVCFSKCSEKAPDDGSLCVEWSVFLPLDNPEYIHDEGGTSFHLSLHGYFFVDSGRTNVDFGKPSDSSDGPENEVHLRQLWNRAIAEKGTLRLVLPVLEDFVRTQKIPNIETDRLTTLLSKSNLFSEHRSSICSEYQWLYCLDVTGGSWRLVESTQQHFEIPRPSSGEAQQFELLPRLTELCQDHCFTYKGSPRLVLGRTAAWTESMIEKALDIDVSRVFSSDEHIRYFLSFLRTCLKKNTQDQSIGGTLAKIGWRLVQEFSVNHLNKHKGLLREFFSLIPASMRFTLQKSLSPALRRLLLCLKEAELDLIFLPKEFESEAEGEQGVARISSPEAVKVLRRLATLLSEVREDGDINSICSSVVLEILISEGLNWREVLVDCAELQLFVGLRTDGGSRGRFSFNELEEMRDRGTLFTYSNPPHRRGLASELQQCIVDPIVLVDTEMAKTLFGEQSIGPCNETACLGLLMKAPSLDPQYEKRAALLTLLLRVDKDTITQNRLALRYLLHGQQSHFRDAGPLLIKEEVKGSSLWARVTRQILTLQHGGWCLLPATISDNIAATHWTSLGLKALDQQAVIDLMKEVPRGQIDLSAFSPEERKEIFRRIDDLDLLAELPIHETMDDNLTAVTSETFLQDEEAFDTLSIGNVIVIRQYEEPALAAKQRQIIPPLDHRAIIYIICSQDRPEDHWRTIMDCLSAIGFAVSDDLVLSDRLKSTTWLPVKGGTQIEPSHVIEVAGLEDEVGLVLTQIKTSLTPGENLLQDVREHNAYAILRKCLFPPAGDALEVLSQKMAEHETFRIGTLATIGIEEFIEVFRNVPLEHLRAYRLTSLAADHISMEACKDRLIPTLAGKIAPARLENLMKFLFKEHTVVSGGRRSLCKRFYDLCLAQLVGVPDFGKILPRIKLLSRSGTWKEAAKLCVNVEGVCDSDLLDEEQAQILFSVTGGAPGFSAAQIFDEAKMPVGSRAYFEQTGQRLQDYFRAWEGLLPMGAVGGFLSVLGDHHGIRNLAAKYLHPRTVDNVRARLPWSNLTDSLGRPMDVHETMAKYRFVVDIVAGDRLEVLSLTGEKFLAELTKDLKHLIAGSTYSTLGKDTYRMTVRQIVPRFSSSEELKRLLSVTTYLVLHAVFRQSSPSIKEFWEWVVQSEQLDIKIAQNLILESAFFYLRQLGLPSNDAIRRVVNKWEDARRRSVEEESLPQQAARKGRASDDVKNARAELEALLKSDSEVQGIILRSVQEKMFRHYQYKPSSVPFEIFQNADDAVVELDTMNGSGDKNHKSDVFVVQIGDSNLSFVHWGRLINQYALGGFDGRKMGYDRDLEKMLILSSSDKPLESRDEKPPVTGKFGLGFKSVLLVTDAPKVISGQLGFKVMAGLFPQRISGEEFQSLQERLRQTDQTRKDGTLFELPLNTSIDKSNVIEPFLSCLHVLLVFAKKIKHCSVYMQNHELGRTLMWTERRVPGTEGVSSGSLVPFHSTAGSLTGLVFRSRHGSVLVSLSSVGAVSLPSEIPTIWVTAPTTHRVGLGFAVNGMFDVDIGRAQIAQESSFNLELARRIGEETGRGLCQLHAASLVDWEQFKNDLGLAGDVTPYDFWASIWKVLGESFSKRHNGKIEYSLTAMELMRVVMWGGRHCGLRRAAHACPILPSLLWNSFKVLIRLDQIQHVVVGTLDTEEVFERVSKWKVFATRFEPEKIISGRVWSTVMRVAEDEKRIPTIDLAGLLDLEIGSARKTGAQKAIELGGLVTNQFIGELEKGNETTQQERKEILAILREVYFRARDGQHYPARELLIENSPSREHRDECLRAAFAPDNRVLDSNYQENGLKFFEACRGQLSAPAKQMAEWVFASYLRDKKAAVLRYLLEGELGRELADELYRQGIEGTWLEGLEKSDVLRGFDVHDRSVILGRLKLAPLIRPIIVLEPPLDPKVVLERVYAWWQANEEHLIREYEQTVYPPTVFGLQPPDLCTEVEKITFDINERKKWLVLFLLGSFHTMGRTVPGQHRSFLTECEENGWLSTFSDPDRDPKAWIRVIEQYIDRQVDHMLFYQWMKQFVSIFGLARYLDDYVELFLGLNRIGHFTLDSILAPRSASVFQGGGISAPPLSRVLGIGACFVARELARKQIVTNSQVHRYCYAPVGRLRKLLGYMGCNFSDQDSGWRWEISGEISEFLVKHIGSEKAAFNLAFDIPLLIISEDGDLQRQFLNRELPDAVADSDVQEGIL